MKIIISGVLGSIAGAFVGQLINVKMQDRRRAQWKEQLSVYNSAG